MSWEDNTGDNDYAGDCERSLKGELSSMKIACFHINKRSNIVRYKQYCQGVIAEIDCVVVRKATSLRKETNYNHINVVELYATLKGGVK